MAYTKVNFVDGVTPLNAANLGKMDNELALLDAAPAVPAVVNGQWLKGVGGAAVWSAITPADVAPIPYSGTLPASPYDGMEAILTDGVSYQWRLRYNAGSGSPYKWEFIGGSPWVTLETAVVMPGSAQYWCGPYLSTPRAGDWLVDQRTEYYGPTGDNLYMRPAVFNVGALLGQEFVTTISGAQSSLNGLGYVQRLNALAAGTNLGFGFRARVGPISSDNRQSVITPIRLG
jgi:hypothetical protein